MVLGRLGEIFLFYYFGIHKPPSAESRRGWATVAPAVSTVPEPSLTRRLTRRCAWGKSPSGDMEKNGVEEGNGPPLVFLLASDLEETEFANANAHSSLSPSRNKRIQPLEPRSFFGRP